MWTDARGDRVFSAFSGEPLQARRRIVGTITGGTGRYAGVRASTTLTWQYVVARQRMASCRAGPWISGAGSALGEAAVTARARDGGGPSPCATAVAAFAVGDLVPAAARRADASGVAAVRRLRGGDRLGVVNALPILTASVLAVAASVLTGLLSPAKAYAGFANGTILLIVLAFLVARAVVKCGLGSASGHAVVSRLRPLHAGIVLQHLPGGRR